MNKTVWLQISSGTGPGECMVAVDLFYKWLKKEAKDVLCDLIERNIERGLTRSMLLSIDADLLKKLNICSGTVQWIAKSKLRRNHRRKNWFIDLTLFTPPQSDEIDLSELKIDTMRAGGPGGQHQNKTESAVRITHLPTGIMVVARSERSQMMNRKLALARLVDQLKQIEDQKAVEQGSERWQRHHQLKRGESILVFKGEGFKPQQGK